MGAGLSIADIEKHNFPIPKRDMMPTTIEEKIICFADKFFQKTMSRSKKSRFRKSESSSQNSEKRNSDSSMNG